MEDNNVEFTHDELIQALEAARIDTADDPTFYTAPQIAEIYEINIVQARKRIAMLIQAGRMEPCNGVITNYLGSRTGVRGVRLIGEKQ